MSSLNRILNERRKAEDGVKVRPTGERKLTGRFSAPDDPAPDDPDRKRFKKKHIFLLSLIVILLGIIYIPQFFIKDVDRDTNVPVSFNKDALSEFATLLESNPDADWDNDGLANKTEKVLGSDPLDPDSDGDGVYDGYENSNHSNPVVYNKNILKKAVKKEDKKNGSSLDTPYMVGDVILWADNYKAKAQGSVVKTLNGYRFTGFKGFAQFSSGRYAYRVTDNGLVPLKYNEKENIWKISGDWDVLLYDKKLEEIALVRVGKKPVLMRRSFFSDVLVTLLPEKGPLTAVRCTSLDLLGEESKAYRAYTEKLNAVNPVPERLSKNMNTLEDYNTVRNVIMNDEKPVTVSLFNKDKGELIGLIFAYDTGGIYSLPRFIISDPLTGEMLGSITVTEKSKQIIDANGKRFVNNYFDFKGMGFDSGKGDRISFFIQ